MRNISISELVSCCKTFLDIVGLIPVSHNRDFRRRGVDAHNEAFTFRESFHKRRAYTVERGLFMQTRV